MDFGVEYWHWFVLGVVLILLEIPLLSFFILWFGAAALLVSLLLFLLPDLSLTTQIVIWTATSITLTVLWFKYLKPLSIDKTKAGLSRESIVGEVGQVLVAPNDSRRGTLRFPAPILSADEWEFLSQDDVAIGDRVRVIDISGNSLIVCKHDSQN